MMEKVCSGDALVIRASTWNAFVDAANYVKEARQNQLGHALRSGVDVGIVLVKNTEAAAYPRFSALVLSGVCVTAAANEDEFVSCTPVFKGAKATSQNAGMPFAVLLEPVAKDEVGRAMVLGITPAKVNVKSASDGYAAPKAGSEKGELESAAEGVARILWKADGTGEQWAILQLGGAGGGGGGGDPAVLCQVNGGSSRAGYQVIAYPKGRNDSSGSYSAVLYVPDIALDAELPVGTWIVGHPVLLTSTGGSET